jgi:hypothetical protein
MERSPCFVQLVEADLRSADALCLLQPPVFEAKPTNPNHIIIRTERQTFKRLPKSGAIVFAVKTNLRRLTTLHVGELEGFVKDVRSWPEAMARYKGRHCWGDVALRYCEQAIGEARTTGHGKQPWTDGGVSSVEV